MSDAARGGPPQFVVSTVVEVPAERVMEAFFSHADLSYWWGVERSVTVPRPTGAYAITWPAGDRTDPVLEMRGGTLHGTVMDYYADRELFLADVFWQPADGEPLGPMAIEVTCTPELDPTFTRVSVRQSASDTGPRWDRYFSLSRSSWARALDTLKDFLENEWLYRAQALKDGRS